MTPTQVPPQAARKSEQVETFCEDVLRLCALIEEAAQYGASTAMEAEYKALRRQATAGYRAVRTDVATSTAPFDGFHGCGFEMLLGPISLDALTQGSPTKTVAKLREVVKSVGAQFHGATWDARR